MADLCRGSGAHADPLAGGLVTLAPTAIEAAILPFVGRKAAVFLSSILGFVTYEVESVCTGTAPDAVTLTQDDYAALADYLNIFTFAPAVAKLKQWFLAWYWQFLCRCNDGLAPALPANPNSTGTVSDSPGLPSGASGPNCWDVKATRQIEPTNHWYWNNILPQLGDAPGWPAGLGKPAQKLPLPLPSLVVLNCVAGQVGGPGQNFSSNIQFYDAAGVLINTAGASSATTPGGVPFSIQSVVPSNAVYLNCIANNQAAPPSPPDMTGEVIFYCQGQSPTQTIVPCCPPDPSLVQMLNQIYGMVTLLQRQVAPFAYVPGATHTALTGNGVLPVQGLLGVKVSPTTIPPGVGASLGDPDTLWLDSWINWGNADGWAEREWLRSAPYVSLPALAGQYTKVGYTLRPGLVVDVTELKREP